jgi:predicted phage replisome organizer
MADVKWIKITTDIFDDEKISLIDGMPERDGIIVIWFKLLCMAGKLNNGGVFMLNDKIAYTDEMLATIFRRPLSTVRLALKTFEQFGMVDIINNAYIIPNWEKHQSLGKMEAAKEKNRQRVAAHREKQKQLAQCNDYGNDDVMPCNALEEDKEEDKKENRIDYKHIIEMYNDTCVSLPKVQSLSEKRKKAIKARLNTYTVEQFKEMFINAENSNFLKGQNDRNWQANFDWLIKDGNFARVLDGNFNNHSNKQTEPQEPKRYGGTYL